MQTEGLFGTESPIPDKVLIKVPSVAESDNSEGDIVNTMALLPKNTVGFSRPMHDALGRFVLLNSPPTPTSLAPWNVVIHPLFSIVQVVRISGNNRTKSSLVGQKAVVRRSIGLGGWHWLVRNVFFFLVL